MTQKIAGALHIGRMPEKVKSILAAESDMVYLAESVLETAIYRNFRAPGTYISSGRMGFVGYFALTGHRIVVRAGLYNKIDVNLLFDEPAFKQVAFTVRPRYLAMKFDPSCRMPDMSGEIEIRLHIPDVTHAAQLLSEKGANLRKP